MVRRYHRVLIGIGVLAAVQGVAIGIYCIKRSRPNVPAFASESLAPRAAPVLGFERADGTTGSLGELGGNVVMVHFWATWCVPCRDELPSLLTLASEVERAGRFRLIAVAVDDDWDAIRRFLGGNVPRTIVRPDTADTHRRFGASTLPDSYLIDARGNVVVRYAGARDWRSPSALEHLERAINKHGGQR